MGVTWPMSNVAYGPMGPLDTRPKAHFGDVRMLCAMAMLTFPLLFYIISMFCCNKKRNGAKDGESDASNTLDFDV